MRHSGSGIQSLLTTLEEEKEDGGFCLGELDRYNLRPVVLVVKMNRILSI